MAGNLELRTDNGSGPLELTEAPIPGKGEPVSVVVRNIGTTVVHTVVIKAEGDGASHVEMSSDGGQWSDGELLFDPMIPGSEESFFVRTSYGVDDVEDRLDFELVAKAISVG